MQSIQRWGVCRPRMILLWELLESSRNTVGLRLVGISHVTSLPVGSIFSRLSKNHLNLVSLTLTPDILLRRISGHRNGKQFL